VVDTGLLYGCLLPHPPILLPAIAGARADSVRRTREAVQQVAGDIQRLDPEVVVLISPHTPMRPLSLGAVLARSYSADFGDFGREDVGLAAPADREMLNAISAECASKGIPLATAGSERRDYPLDHGAAVPLYFLQEAGLRASLVLLAASALSAHDHFAFGKALAGAAASAGKRVVLVSSGDLSHRLTPGAPAGYSPRGAEFDQHIVSALVRNDWSAVLGVDSGLLAEAGECGYRSLAAALGAMEGSEGEVLSYEGPFGVGYLVARFRPESASPKSRPNELGTEIPAQVAAEERAALDLARLAVEHYVRYGEPPPFPAQPPVGLLARRAGVFVCLKVDGRLRGCVGTLQPSEDTIAAEVVRSAISAAARDPRFPCVTPEELDRLRYSIDILSSSEPVDDLAQLDPKRYGIVIQAGPRRSLLLPDLPGVDSVESQIGIARRKAGIADVEAIDISRFRVYRIEEPSQSSGDPA
jgi:MEMO1 family protein